MALIKNGSLNDFSVKRRSWLLEKESSIGTLGELAQVSKDTPVDSFRLVTSTDQRGVGIKSILLNEGFEGFLGNIFKPTNDLYFVALAWDLSGQPVVQYPGAGVKPEEVLIPMRVGKVREFIGQGIDLWPKQAVVGGISIRIQLWESDKSTRDFGATMQEVAGKIKDSQLNYVLSLISLASGVSGATLELIKSASVQLMDIIGAALQTNKDDYCDFYEGNYAADQDWKAGEDRYEGNSSIITLNKY